MAVVSCGMGMEMERRDQVFGIDSKVPGGAGGRGEQWASALSLVLSARCQKLKQGAFVSIFTCQVLAWRLEH